MWGTIISLGFSSLAMLMSTIFSSMASEAAFQRNYQKAHSYSKWSAIISAVAMMLALFGIFLAFNSKAIANSLSKRVSGLQNALSTYGSS